MKISIETMTVVFVLNFFVAFSNYEYINLFDNPSYTNPVIYFHNPDDIHKNFTATYRYNIQMSSSSVSGNLYSLTT